MSAIQTWRARSANERFSLCTYANEWQPYVNGIVVLGLSLRLFHEYETRVLFLPSFKYAHRRYRNVLNET